MKNKNDIIRIRIAEDDKKKLKKIADKQRKTLSQIITDHIYKLIDRES